MVKAALFFILISFQLVSFSLFSQNIVVTSEVNYTEAVAGKPLSGTITITHDKEKQIDADSFKLGNEPLKASFLNNVVISEQSPLIISIYSFELPPKSKGLHVLPEVSVKIGGKTYKSYSRSFEVLGDSFSNSSPPANVQTVPEKKAATSTVPDVSSAPLIGDKPELRLETKIDGSTQIYPGQQIKFTYKFLYKGHIDLAKEELPLLEGAGLTKVGDKQVRDYEENQLSVFESSQIFEAKSPGIYQFGPSIVEGMAYEVLPNGTKKYTKEQLRSETPPVLIEVMPFPAAGKPASFNGAVGQFTFKASLNSAPTLNSGEKLTLLLEISGTPESLSTVKAPDLCCQPGFPGNFKPSDLPPISRISNGTKSFLVDLTPLSANITEIPAIEFSSFDLSQNKYITLKSAPIPITVILKTAETKEKPQEILTPDSANQVQPIEISGNYSLSKSDLQNKIAGSWWNLLWLPAFALLLVLQYNLHKEWSQKKAIVKKTPSIDLFKAALKEDPGSLAFYKSLQNALLAALEEKGEIPSADIEPQELPKTGLSEEVRLFIAKLDELKFSGKRQFSQAVIASAKELYQKIIGS
ncbi:MAG TPA: hypothetical protein PLC42_00700 [Parachlamydiaceae bacterium]|nr:hypothetical protein [Parachlamydiaceae bacterium]